MDQSLPKHAETAGLFDVYTKIQGYSGCSKDIKDYIYLNGEKYRPQNISPINIFKTDNLKNDLLAFLGWLFYKLERLARLYFMFFFWIWISLLLFKKNL